MNKLTPHTISPHLTHFSKPTSAAKSRITPSAAAIYMQGLLPHADGVGVRLELAPPLSIDVAEPAEKRIRRLAAENPVIIFARSACCMCHVMKRLLSSVGVHPTVIELDEHEIAALEPCAAAPALYIGGACVGGVESVVALHLNNSLVPKLVEVGVVSEGIYIT